MNFINNASAQTANDFIYRQCRYFISVIILVGLIGFLPGENMLLGKSAVAFAASDPVIAAAGDIACDPANSNFFGGNGNPANPGACRQKYTSDLLVNANLVAVLPLGDIQYFCGGYQAFLQSYDLSWGRVKSISHPVVGNHEYIKTADPSGPSTGCDITNDSAAGYFNYFGAAAGNKGQGYYSYDIGAWHLIALNSNCSDAGGCSPSSPQAQWLVADLAAHPNVCTLAYWHIPLFSSGGRAELNSRDLWQILYDNGVDVILNGHDHIYERFAPQAPNGVLDSAGGMREFIVGSGGANHTSLSTLAANSEVRNVNTFGVLKLTLHSTSYDWQFVPESGKTFTDSGTGQCHGILPDTISPTAPTGLTASAVSSNQVSLKWTAATDNKGIAGYQIFRDGTQIGSTSSITYSDGTAQPQTTYSYFIKAVDKVGLVSGSSNVATLTTPEAAAILSLTPTADAEIQLANPTLKSGSSVQFVVDNDPIKNALLKFTVSGVGTRTIVSARLRLYCLDGSPFGGEFHRVADTTWNESTVNWNTAPAADAAILASVGKVVANNWYEVDLTSLVKGDGTYSLRVNSTSTDGASYSSKEGTYPPQLIITTTGPTSTPTFTPTATSTSTPTATPTASQSPTSASQGSFLFSDGFETGSLSQWTSGQGLLVQTQQIATGNYAARGTSAAGGATYARKLLATPQIDFYYRIRFNVISQAANTVNLMKLRTAADTPILSVSINNLGNLSYRNDVAGTSVNSTVNVSKGIWQTLQVHVRIADTSSQVEVWYNDVPVAALSRTEALGSSPIGVLQLGENTAGLSYDIAFDDVVASLDFVATGPTSAPTFMPSQTASATSTPTLTATATSLSNDTLVIDTVADTYVQADVPNNNFGSSTQFVADNSPARNMLLKFAVSGIGNQSIVSAKLRLYCVDGSPIGGEFHRAADTTWNENTVNWNTAPAADPTILATLNKVVAGNWYEVDITSLVNGDGTYSLKINSTSSDGAYYSTKEDTAGFAPQLVIKIKAFPTATISPLSVLFNTPLDTITSTPIDTPTTTLTPTPTETPGP